jgi:hypothetical protein
MDTYTYDKNISFTLYDCLDCPDRGGDKGWATRLTTHPEILENCPFSTVTSL